MRNRLRWLVVCCVGLVAAQTNVGLAQEDYQARLAKQRLVYPLGPDSQAQTGVPTGTVTEHEWLESQVFPGTKRRYSVYVPQQYDPKSPAALMVFQDGHEYVKPGGLYRATVVMDNLIAKGEMPVTIGVFVDPGHKKEKLPATRGWQPQPENRSFEYDTLSGDYVRFLLEEILPAVSAKYNLTDDPSGRAICGASSGGICAFTAAWQRPDQFGKVISHIGSFANIRHGDTYPGIIRKTDRKPIRVYLQDGSNDLDNKHGNWPLGNQQMFAALRFQKYDVKFDYGIGGHDGVHGSAMLPDAMRWVWRDYPGVVVNRSTLPVRQTAEWAVPWWMPRHEAKLAELDAMKLQGGVDLLMVGDSITQGWEQSGRPVWNKFYADRNAFAIGFSGDRTEHVIWRLQNGEMAGIAPKVAVVMIGTNNTGQKLSAAKDTAAGVERVVDEILLRSPQTKILLVGIFPRDSQPTDEMRVRNTEINQIIAQLSDEQRIWYLDIGDRFLDDDGVLHKSIMGDLLHPGKQGYQIWAEAMEPMLKQLLSE